MYEAGILARILKCKASLTLALPNKIYLLLDQFKNKNS